MSEPRKPRKDATVEVVITADGTVTHPTPPAPADPGESQ